MLETIDLSLFIKIPVLVLIFLYALFGLTVYNKVRSLGNLVYISDLQISKLLEILALLHLIAAISLFAISLVIL